jgi:acyl-CoA synthetase (AMP-forming)/AMP-acid ligase II
MGIAATRIAARASGSARGPALVDDGGSCGWTEVAGALAAAAGGLQAHAPGPGERWAVLGHNAGPTLLAHAAGLIAGVGTVAASRQLTAAELAYQFADAGVVAVITGADGLAAVLDAAVLDAAMLDAAVFDAAVLDAAVLDAAREVRLRLVVVHGGAAPAAPPVPVLTWDAWLAGAPAATDLGYRPAAPMLVYTSGTTGRPRGTEVRWLPGRDRTAAEYLDALVEQAHTPAGPHLVAGPLQHNGPLTAVRHLLTGEPVVVLGRFDAQAALAAIDRYAVASSVMVPTHFQRLLALPAAVRDRYDVSSVRLLAHTGSACPPPVKRAMIEWFGPVLVESYGGSEVGTLCRIGAADWLAHPGSVGRAVAPYQTVVVDDHGLPLAPGATGLLCFRAPDGHGIAYHHDPAKTAAAYVAPGVLTLGDVGHVDGDGFVYVTDRAVDMVLSGGVNLYPAESERVLAGHPQVGDVAVIGVPHPDLGEQLLALVVPADPGDPPAAAGLEAWCRGQLAAYKCPRRFELVTALPRNAMNKLDKATLRRPYWPTARTVAG